MKHLDTLAVDRFYWIVEYLNHSNIFVRACLFDRIMYIYIYGPGHPWWEYDGVLLNRIAKLENFVPLLTQTIPIDFFDPHSSPPALPHQNDM